MSSACPSCGAPVSDGAKFCAACGASVSSSSAGVPTPAPGTGQSGGQLLASAPTQVSTRWTPSSGTAPPPPQGPAPVDIRQTVDQDRGFLKKVQLLIPGFRGYRLGEDDRAADSILRLEVADRLKGAITTLQGCRESLVQNNVFAGLTDIANAIADLQRLEGRIRFAEQGYSGIAPAIRVNPATLDKLYEYDYGFVAAADQLIRSLAPIQTASASADAAGIQSSVRVVRPLVTQLDLAFQARLRAVEGIQT